MSKPGEKFYIDARGIHASGMVTENGFIVFAGSEVRNHQAAYLAKGLADYRAQCIADGTIVDWYLTKNLEFNSPSTCATFLFGANASGPQTWKDEMA